MVDIPVLVTRNTAQQRDLVGLETQENFHKQNKVTFDL
jgi:hypothetical protein